MSYIKNKNISVEKVRALVQKKIPAIQIKKLEPLGEGWNNIVYIVNDEIIFRFPKGQEAYESLLREVKTLPIIQQKISVQIPDFIFSNSLTSEDELSFVAYKPVQGEFLYSEVYQDLDAEDQMKIQTDFGNMLWELHSISLETVSDCNLDDWGYKDEYIDAIKSIRQKLFHYFSSHECDLINTLFDDFLSNDEHFDFSPRLIHNDLSSDHILINSDTKSLAGIIDWGDIHIGDPDYDFHLPYAEYGEAFIRGSLQTYKHSNPELLICKLRFFYIYSLFDEILYTMDEGVNEESICEIKGRLKQIAVPKGCS